MVHRKIIEKQSNWHHQSKILVYGCVIIDSHKRTVFRTVLHRISQKSTQFTAQNSYFIQAQKLWYHPYLHQSAAPLPAERSRFNGPPLQSTATDSANGQSQDGWWKFLGRWTKFIGWRPECKQCLLHRELEPEPDSLSKGKQRCTWNI